MAETGTAAATGERGPPASLPGQVPDHVSQIQGLVREHLTGTLTGVLGHGIGDVTPDDESDGDDAVTDDATPEPPSPAGDSPDNATVPV